MNLTRTKKILKKIIPKRFRPKTPIEQRAELRSIKRKILANPPFRLLEKVEEIAKTKGKRSKELSILKSKVAMDFNEKFLGFKLTQKKREQAAELINQIEQRERAVEAVGRKKSEDETVFMLKKELKSLFGSTKEYTSFVITYRLYSSEINLLLKKSVY